MAEGRASRYRRIADSGRRVAFHFCPDCGTSVYWEPEARPDAIAVAVGCFADPTFPPPAQSAWDDRRHPWLAYSK